MKLSELLVQYATETAQNKVSAKTAEQFLIHYGIEEEEISQVRGIDYLRFREGMKITTIYDRIKTRS